MGKDQSRSELHYFSCKCYCFNIFNVFIWFLQELCAQTDDPEGFLAYFEYVSYIPYDEDPDYEQIRQFFFSRLAPENQNDVTLFNYDDDDVKDQVDEPNDQNISYEENESEVYEDSFEIEPEILFEQYEEDSMPEEKDIDINEHSHETESDILSRQHEEELNYEHKNTELDGKESSNEKEHFYAIESNVISEQLEKESKQSNKDTEFDEQSHKTEYLYKEESDILSEPHEKKSENEQRDSQKGIDEDSARISAK